MLKRTLPSVAVIADAHFHDTAADFGFPGIEVDGERITMRSWSDTRRSTRVFNESADALHAALEEVRQRAFAMWCCLATIPTTASARHPKR